MLLNKLLEDGNVLFKKNNLSEASHRYQYALRRLPSSFAGQHRPIFEQLQVHLLLNLSRCKRKSGRFDEALVLADQVLNISPASYEAFYARAKANRECGRLREALSDLTAAARVAPHNRDVHRIILRIKEEIREDEKKLQKAKSKSSSPHSSHDTDSTSGVDSSGSSCTTYTNAKDIEHDVSATSVVI